MAQHESELLISPPSSALVTDALRTVPLKSPYYYAELAFFADGVKLPNYRDSGDEERYLRECTQKGIIPHSEIKISGSRPESLQVSDGINGLLSLYELPAAERLSRVGGLLRGGRIHLLDIKDGWSNTDNYRDTMLGNLLVNGYQLGYGQLWLISSSRGSCEYRSEGWDARLWLTGEPEGNLSLQIDRRVSEEDAETFTNWFRGLAQKHGQEIFIPVAV